MRAETTEDVPVVEFTDPRNDMAHWYPELRGLDVPTPETYKLPLDRSGDGPPEWNTSRAAEIVKVLGGEAFARAGYKSAQLAAGEGSHIQAPGPDAVDRTLMELVAQHTLMQMPLGESLWLREYLDLDFCWYERDTLHPEVRAFIRDGEVVCHHPRLEGFDGFDEYRNMAANIIQGGWGNTEGYKDHDPLSVMAQRVADAMGGWWSVDFVMDRNGDWYLTDMALDAVYDQSERGGEGYASVSHHPEDCPHDVMALFDGGERA